MVKVGHMEGVAAARHLGLAENGSSRSRKGGAFGQLQVTMMGLCPLLLPLATCCLCPCHTLPHVPGCSVVPFVCCQGPFCVAREKQIEDISGQVFRNLELGKQQPNTETPETKVCKRRAVVYYRRTEVFYLPTQKRWKLRLKWPRGTSETGLGKIPGDEVYYLSTQVSESLIASAPHILQTAAAARSCISVASIYRRRTSNTAATLELARFTTFKAQGKGTNTRNMQRAWP